MYFTDAYYVSPGARSKGYATRDELPEKLDALPGILPRLDALEKAVCIMAGAGGDDDGDDGQGATDAAPEMDYTPGGAREDVASKLKFQRKRNDGNNVRADGSASETDDELPDSPADINNRNRMFWSAPKSSESMSAGGSPSTTPSPGAGRESEGAAFMPGKRNITGNTSRTPKELDMGSKVWTGDIQRRSFYGATKDGMAQGQRTIDRWAAQSSAAIASISDKWSARR